MMRLLSTLRITGQMDTTTMILSIRRSIIIQIISRLPT